MHRAFNSSAFSKALTPWLDKGYDFDSPAGRYSMRLIALPIQVGRKG